MVLECKRQRLNEYKGRLRVSIYNTIKAGGSTKRAQNVGLDWSGWMDGYPLDCYDY